MQPLTFQVMRTTSRLCLACFVFSGLVGVSRGASLTWDANGAAAANPSDGSGAWLGAGNWWTGAMNTNGNWTSAGPDSVVFGAGVSGAYFVNLGGSNLYASNITFNTSSYMLTNGTLTLLDNGTALTVASNVAATFKGALNVSGSSTLQVATNATVSFAGGGAMAANTILAGNGTVDFAAGTFASGNFVVWAQAPVTQEAAALNTARVMVGYGGKSTYTINDPAAVLTSTGGGGDSFAGRSGSTGTLDLKQGTVTLTAVSGDNFRVGYDANSKGTLLVEGGNFNLGGNTLYVNFGATSSGGSGVVDVSGGTVTAGGIQLGGGGNFASGATASLNVTGGTIYLGAGGISKNALGTLASGVSLSGGTLGASAAWGSALPMTLSGTGGDVTLQAADATAKAKNISLAGILSGAGGLVKTGGGILNLSAANSYAGNTAVNAGTLATTTGSTGGGSYSVASNATLAVQASAGSALGMSALTLANGATLELDLAGTNSPGIAVSGVLGVAGRVNLNIGGSTLTAGEYPLVTYGSISGNALGAFVLGPFNPPLPVGTTAQIVSNISTHRLDLVVTVAAGGGLTWDGTVSGSWDVGGTANWKGGKVYEETNGVGPAVVFSDAASGTRSVTLNGVVSPASVVVSNSTVAYGIGGAGGIAGATGLLKEGAGVLTLGGNNTYTGGTTLDGGTLVLSPTSNVAMAYALNGGTLDVAMPVAGGSLRMTSLTLSSSAPQVTFDFENAANTIAPAVNIAGTLTMNGNVALNVSNANFSATGVAVLIRYGGLRNGSGNFVAGNVPAGVVIFDDTLNEQVIAYQPGPRVVVPSLNTNEVVVAVATPQEFGAHGDGITDDSAAFQNAINAVYNSGGSGGGVIFVPAGNYAFYTNISLPTGVTLHGDWGDWVRNRTAAVGTTFKIYYGAGNTNDAPFIFLNRSTALKGVNIWYPDQNPAAIVGYPFSIGVGGGKCGVMNVALVNSYQGIQSAGGAQHVLSTVVGTPLFMGIAIDGQADISQTEDIRFSPDAWANSGLSNAPIAGGSYAAWMRANGEGMQLYRADGEWCLDTFISGYKVGIEANQGPGGVPGASFYSGAVSNCGTALLAQEMQGQSGLEITRMVLDGDTGVSRTHTTNDATIGFSHCQIIGRNGIAVSSTGADWHSWMAFQDCTISNTMVLAGAGVFNVVNCNLQGATQCQLSSKATRAAFIGCNFSPAQNIVNQGSALNLIVDGRRPIPNALPMLDWTNTVNDYLSRRPSKLDLFVATNFGAIGNGTRDDTAGIQSALTAAGNNGGGIVYLPGGKYKLTGTLDVPGGVELRGPFELRHYPWSAPDNHAKGAVLQPYGGQGTTNGPPAIVLEANSGAVGLTISYETQNTNCIPFPPAIQGRGGNIYAISIVSPNPYTFIDFDTYTCTNHLIYMVDGWAINSGYVIGNGSSGSIVDCHCNWTYWWDNYDSASDLSSNLRPPVRTFAEHNLTMYIFGDCTEVMLKDFSIAEHRFMQCISENGRGPNINGVSAGCDGTVQGYIFDAAAPCSINLCNSSWTANYTSQTDFLTNDTVTVLATTNFQGTVRFFNVPVFGGPKWDYIVNGGDVGFELVHMLDHSELGSSVSGGVFHLVNSGEYITKDPANRFPPYAVTFGPNAGIAGKVSEIIGSYAFNGNTNTNSGANNPLLAWGNYDLSSPYAATASFAITAPALSLSRSSSDHVLNFSWPASQGVFNLYAANTLGAPAQWALVNAPMTFSNNRWSTTVDESSTGQFFRLQHQ